MDPRFANMSFASMFDVFFSSNIAELLESFTSLIMQGSMRQFAFLGNSLVCDVCPISYPCDLMLTLAATFKVVAKAQTYSKVGKGCISAISYRVSTADPFLGLK
jgi:hypothetical protein